MKMVTEEIKVCEFPLFENDEKANQIADEQYENGRLTKAKLIWRNILWRNLAALATVHVLAFWGLLHLGQIQNVTLVYLLLILYLSSVGVQAGAHRLWSHRSYSANFGLRLFLSLCFVMAGQNDVYQWARDHRVHHKYSETDADPHNVKRGFFYSHVGWLLVKKHADVGKRGKAQDLQDLKDDPIVMFQRQYYVPLMLLFWGVIPAILPVYGWNESWSNAITVCVFFRYAYALNVTWLANSWCHMFGSRPYDRRLAAVDSTIRHFLIGEGFHNYHHAFPWDYSTSELGAAQVFNPMTATINFFAWMGWAWDLKKPKMELIESKRKQPGLDLVDYRTHSAVYEWVTGMITLVAPFTLLRMTLLMLNY